MFFKKDVKNFVNNNVITSHIVGNGNKVINVVNGNTVNNANSKSKEVAKKSPLNGRNYLRKKRFRRASRKILFDAKFSFSQKTPI